MNKEWWYEIQGQRLGPISTDVLRNLHLTGQISRDTLVWQRGFDSWRPLAEVLPATATEPPPLPLSSTIGEATPLSLARPSRRFFARHVDGIFFGMLLTVPSYAFFAWLENHLHLSSSLIFATFRTMLSYALVLAAEALVFSLFHTTLGKALLGIRVLNIDGQQLTGKAYGRRLLGLFFYGLGLGIFLLPLIAMFVQYLRVADKRPTYYDEGKFTVLATTQLPAWRIVATILFIVAVFVVGAAVLFFVVAGHLLNLNWFNFTLPSSSA